MHGAKLDKETEMWMRYCKRRWNKKQLPYAIDVLCPRLDYFMNQKGLKFYKPKTSLAARRWFFCLFSFHRTWVREMSPNKKTATLWSCGFCLVPTTGFEPAHLMAPPPQDGMSTNFTTWAFGAQK